MGFIQSNAYILVPDSLYPPTKPKAFESGADYGVARDREALFPEIRATGQSRVSADILNQLPVEIGRIQRDEQQSDNDEMYSPLSSPHHRRPARQNDHEPCHGTDFEVDGIGGHQQPDRDREHGAVHQ